MNMATIDLEVPDSEDLEWMKGLVDVFVQETDSKIGSSILENWDTECKHFIKVSAILLIFFFFSLFKKAYGLYL